MRSGLDGRSKSSAKKWALCLLLIALPSSAVQRPKYIPPSPQTAAAGQVITAAELENGLATAKKMSDGDLATEIDSLELTERLSEVRLARCETYLRGRESKLALRELADRSAFKPPSAEEILSLAPPDFAAQKQMLSLTTRYVVNTLNHLPNFYAKRTTTTYGRNPAPDAGTQFVDKQRVTVTYRDGHEVVDSKKHKPKQGMLITQGEFGPILALAILDAAKGKLTWSRWEQGSAGPQAVYSYTVTASDSHWEVGGKSTAYTGQIALDPSNGNILRITLQTLGDPKLKNTASEDEVDYGAVDLGGKTYICPVRSVAVSRTPKSTWISDAIYDDYHLFSTESRIVPNPPQTR